MTSLIPIVILLVGAAIGALVAWLMLNAKTRRAFEDGKSDSATQIAAFNERLAAKERELVKLHQAFDEEVTERDSSREENSRLRANLEGERRAATERSESFKQAA